MISGGGNGGFLLGVIAGFGFMALFAGILAGGGLLVLVLGILLAAHIITSLIAIDGNSEGLGCFGSGFFYGNAAYALLLAVLYKVPLPLGLKGFQQFIFALLGAALGGIQNEIVAPPKARECI
jgi:hypothetical protein